MKLFNAYHKGITMSTINEQPICVGTINDAGILLALKRKGITTEKSLSELFANSIDAGCNGILYKISQSNIKLIDDGKGMNMEKIQNMFDIHKENHKNDKSLGVSGVGGKVSLLILSNDTSVVLYTKSVNGQYYKVEIPWDEMLQQVKYTGMIRRLPMSENEVVEFHKERDYMKNKNTGNAETKYNLFAYIVAQSHSLGVRTIFRQSNSSYHFIFRHANSTDRSISSSLALRVVKFLVSGFLNAIADVFFN